MSKQLVTTIVFNSLINNVGSYNANTFKHILYLRRKQFTRRMSLLSSIKQIKRNIPKCRNYLKVIESYPNDVFFSHFRMNRSTFSALERILKPMSKSRGTGRPAYSLKQCLYVTLWKLASQCSFREISDRFGMGRGTVYRVFTKTLMAIIKLKKKFIKWPESDEYRYKIVEEFEEKRSNPVPFVLGCVDGTHFKIPAPKEDSTSYYNRKGTHSIIMQGVCDSNFIFTDVFVGYPGSCHDAAVWRASPLQKAIVSGKIKVPPEYHLLGDSAYPLDIHLMVPYRDNGHLTEEQKRFNYCHSSTRVFIEQAFGILKKNFRILNFIPVQKIPLVKRIVMSCVILHNFIILHEIPNYSYMNQCPVDSLSEEDIRNDDHHPIPNNEAKLKRERLTTLFSA